MKMLGKSLLICLCVILACTIGGCAKRKNLSPVPTISDDAKTKLDGRVNCKTAKRDIAILEEERASVAKQVLSGARSVMPISAAVGILMGDYRDRVRVTTGQYNRDIDAKIAQIKRTCYRR